MLFARKYCKLWQVDMRVWRAKGPGQVPRYHEPSVAVAGSLQRLSHECPIQAPKITMFQGDENTLKAVALDELTGLRTSGFYLPFEAFPDPTSPPPFLERALKPTAARAGVALSNSSIATNISPIHRILGYFLSYRSSIIRVPMLRSRWLDLPGELVC